MLGLRMKTYTILDVDQHMRNIAVAARIRSDPLDYILSLRAILYRGAWVIDEAPVAVSPFSLIAFGSMRRSPCDSARSLPPLYVERVNKIRGIHMLE